MNFAAADSSFARGTADYRGSFGLTCCQSWNCETSFRFADSAACPWQSRLLHVTTATAVAAVSVRNWYCAAANF